MPEFQGFSQESLDLLVQIRLHNSKEYYEQHKPDYQRLLQQPFRQLIADISPALQAIEPGFQLDPRRCISRLRRDTRFSRDKSMYRDTMWFFIRKLSEGWLQGAGFYFEISPVAFRYGFGYFDAPPAEMAIFRQQIAIAPRKFARMVQPIVEDGYFNIEGDMYKRDMGDGLPKSLYDWYNRKAIYLSHNGSDIQRIMQPEFAPEMAQRFESLKDIYAFFSSVCEEYRKTTQQ